MNITGRNLRLLAELLPLAKEGIRTQLGITELNTEADFAWADEMERLEERLDKFVERVDRAIEKEQSSGK